MSRHAHLFAVAASALIAAPAAAVTLVSSIAGAPDPGVPSGFTTVVTFDAPSAAGIVNTVTGAVITAAGDIGGIRAAPAGTPVGGVYQSVGTDGTSSFDFSGYLAGRPLTGLSLYWGSVDDYNFIDFYSRSGSLLQTISGTDLPQFDGDQTAPITNRRLTFAINAVDDVTRLVFRSEGNAFEFDTIAVSPEAIPEPGTWAMLIAGFGLVGAAMRRRQRQVRALA
jgi:hypothetical protein